MDFEKVLSLRQAVRAYTDEPVSEEQLKAILNAAYRAPMGISSDGNNPSGAACSYGGYSQKGHRKR